MFCMLRLLNLGYTFLKGALFGFKFPLAISIDVTNKCNLRCKHCYFWSQKHTSELSDKGLLKKVKQIKKNNPSIFHATWVGGEPLLRKCIVKEGMKYFPFNMVVTNGSIKLPKWKNCTFNVSVDGTKKYYEEIRGKGTYDVMKKNANRSDVKVNIACVLTKKNYTCIEELLKEWSKTKVRGIHFDFYTPIKGNADLWLNWEQRDKIIKQIITLRKKYGNFILNSRPILELMKSKNAKKLMKNCPIPKAAVCISPIGTIKKPCVIGEHADCSRCGCIIAYFIESFFVRKQFGSFVVAYKGYV
jgi:Fe-coproporphyrin III synthase